MGAVTWAYLANAPFPIPAHRSDGFLGTKAAGMRFINCNRRRFYTLPLQTAHIFSSQPRAGQVDNRGSFMRSFIAALVLCLLEYSSSCGRLYCIGLGYWRFVVTWNEEPKI